MKILAQLFLWGKKKIELWLRGAFGVLTPACAFSLTGRTTEAGSTTVHFREKKIKTCLMERWHHCPLPVVLFSFFGDVLFLRRQFCVAWTLTSALEKHVDTQDSQIKKLHLSLATLVKVAKTKERKHHVAQHEVSLLRLGERVFILPVVLKDLLCLQAGTSCCSICKGICCIYIELWLILLCLMGLFTRLMATVS